MTAPTPAEVEALAFFGRTAADSRFSNEFVGSLARQHVQTIAALTASSPDDMLREGLIDLLAQYGHQGDCALSDGSSGPCDCWQSELGRDLRALLGEAEPQPEPEGERRGPGEPPEGGLHFGGRKNAAPVPSPVAAEERPRCHQCGPGYWIGDDGCRHTAPEPVAAAQDEDAIDKVRKLHRPYWIDGAGTFHRHVVLVEDDDEHACITDGVEACSPEGDEHYALACVECQGATDYDEVPGFALWPCPTAALLAETMRTPEERLLWDIFANQAGPDPMAAAPEDLYDLLRDHDYDRMECADHVGRCCPAGCHDVQVGQYRHYAELLRDHDARVEAQAKSEALDEFGDFIATPRHPGLDGPTLYEVYLEAHARADDLRAALAAGPDDTNGDQG